MENDIKNILNAVKENQSFTMPQVAEIKDLTLSLHLKNATAESNQKPIADVMDI